MKRCFQLLISCRPLKFYFDYVLSGEIIFVAQDGRLVIKIQKGRVSQMERTVQSRFTGLDGEGI